MPHDKNGLRIEIRTSAFTPVFLTPHLRLSADFFSAGYSLRLPEDDSLSFAYPESTRPAAVVQPKRTCGFPRCGSALTATRALPVRAYLLPAHVRTFFFSRSDNRVSGYIPGISLPARCRNQFPSPCGASWRSNESAKRDTRLHLLIQCFAHVLSPDRPMKSGPATIPVPAALSATFDVSASNHRNCLRARKNVPAAIKPRYLR